MANDYQYRVTVGFPVYNVEKYVHRSLKSVLDQDLDNFEVIVVDDCGKDGSMNVIRELIESHPKGESVHIIRHEQNAGLAEARNTAIKNAKGKYIYFLDSDDYIPQNALSTLYHTAEKYQTDIVYGSSLKDDGSRIYEDEDNKLPYKLFIESGSYTSFLYNDIRDVIPVVAWNALLSMDFLTTNHLLFPNIRYQEDLAFDEVFQPYVKRAVMLPDKTYYYVMRADSLMNKQAREKIDIGEAIRAIKLCNLMKETCHPWKDRDFYGGKCARVMKKCFFQTAGILKHRYQFSEPMTNREIRDIMKHPESLMTIIFRFKQLKKYNLLYYVLGILPPTLSVYLINFICHQKKYY